MMHEGYVNVWKKIFSKKKTKQFTKWHLDSSYTRCTERKTSGNLCPINEIIGSFL